MYTKYLYGNETQLTRSEAKHELNCCQLDVSSTELADLNDVIIHHTQVDARYDAKNTSACTRDLTHRLSQQDSSTESDDKRQCCYSGWRQRQLRFAQNIKIENRSQLVSEKRQWIFWISDQMQDLRQSSPTPRSTSARILNPSAVPSNQGVR